MASKLGRWLGALTAAQLTEILTRRPDVLKPVPPQTLGELADRLQSRQSVTAAFHSLPQPAVQLVEVLQAFGGPTVARAQVAAAVGRTPDDPDLDATLHVLAQRGLVWPHGDELRMAGPLWSAFAYPLHLGPPAERLLSARTAEDLRRIAAALDVPTGRSKQQVLKDLVAALTEGDQVRHVVAQAPAETRDVLTRIAWRGPVVRHPQIIYGYGHCADPVLDWALSRGLLVADGWQAAVMPGEVGRALRGQDWRAPFTPAVPVPALIQVDQAAVVREAAAAAVSAVAEVTALLQACAATPVAMLKAGGVGARELRRLAKTTGSEEANIRLWLELAYAAGLLGTVEDQVLPSPAYDEWRGCEPPQRLVPLLQAWWRAPVVALGARSVADDAPVAALVRTGFGDVLVQVRRELMRAAAELPDGRGVADDAGLAPLLTWRAPLLTGPLADPEGVVTATWREASLLGLVGHGALTPLGRVLTSGGTGLDEVAARLLPEAVETALYQADLTAVVPGTPTAGLAELLDSTADRESVGGGAAIWRFSPTSVRRALDTGATVDSLLAALAGAAAGATLPQPLEYLACDVGRRHGQVRVRSVACVLRAEDPALLAEIVAVRALAPLGLALLAPTVASSQRPVAETLAALRAAGYAPVIESADGSPVLERVPRQRARRVATRRAVPAPRGAAPPEPGVRPRVDPAGVAEALLAGPVPDDGPDLALVTAPVRAVRHVPAPTETPPVPDDTAAVLEAKAPQLSGPERRLLTHAIDFGTRVKIRYTDGDGNSSARVVEPMALSGHLMEAWCHLREDERNFVLDRIDAVTPA